MAGELPEGLKLNPMPDEQPAEHVCRCGGHGAHGGLSGRKLLHHKIFMSLMITGILLGGVGLFLSGMAQMKSLYLTKQFNDCYAQAFQGSDGEDYLRYGLDNVLDTPVDEKSEEYLEGARFYAELAKVNCGVIVK